MSGPVRAAQSIRQPIQSNRSKKTAASAAAISEKSCSQVYSNWNSPGGVTVKLRPPFVRDRSRPLTASEFSRLQCALPRSDRADRQEVFSHYCLGCKCVGRACALACDGCVGGGLRVVLATGWGGAAGVFARWS